MMKKVIENSSMGGVSAGSIGGSAGGLGQVAATVKKQKSKKLVNGQTILQRTSPTKSTAS